jgi:hypothetical protein
MKHDPSDTGYPDNPYTSLLDMEEMGPEGTPLELFWYLNGQAARGMNGAAPEAEKLRKIAEEEIRSNAELAIKALHFPNPATLLRWLETDREAYRMAMAYTTYREILERSWASGEDK